MIQIQDRSINNDRQLFTGNSLHEFHIPVLGTGYSIDTPLKVARFGIASVMSMVDDQLVEQMREYHCEKLGLPYEEIPAGSEDSRARRFTAYFNFIDERVQKQIEEMRAMAFTGESLLDQYFQLLPDVELRSTYERMMSMPEGDSRLQVEGELKSAVVAGSIDVNIMTKLDGQPWLDGKPVDPYYSDASAALRGYANSTFDSTIIFSAGMNPRLFAAISEYPDFHANEEGYIKKRICLKVSDYRSALIQGKLLAKKGLWVSEYRIESGLNCGGHAFPSKGHLLGPILEDFYSRRNELEESLFPIYQKACEAIGRSICTGKIAVTVQGGVGTAEEHHFLREHYQVDAVGWGTPFLLVPEAVNLDEDHMDRLCKANEFDVFLSDASPIGVPFWNLQNSDSEKARKQRIIEGKPGVFCAKKHLALNTEFGEKPLCPAEKRYQKLKLEEIEAENHPLEIEQGLKEKVLAKACLCGDLAMTAVRTLGIVKKGTSAITPGPNIVNFSKIVSLKEMVGHIYGKVQLVTAKARPHMFLREIELYIDYSSRELADCATGIMQKSSKYFDEVHENLQSGIEYYRDIANRFFTKERGLFLQRLDHLKAEVANIFPKVAVHT